jgi:hypothetical protein
MNEFVLMVDSLGLGFSPEEVHQLQHCLDQDYDGTVDMNEFVTSAPQLLQVRRWAWTRTFSRMIVVSAFATH